MKLSVVVGSPNSRKVLAVARHLGLTPELEYLDFFAGDLRTPAFLARNPNGMVPVLQDGGFILFESNAIMLYMAAQVPGHPLMPQDPRARALVQQWMSWEGAHFNKALGVLAFETLAKPGMMGMAPDEAAVAWAQPQLARFAPVLEHALQGRDYLLGQEPTLADYAVGHLEFFALQLPFDWSGFPRTRAYFARIAALPHWAATAPPSPQAVGRRPPAG